MAPLTRCRRSSFSRTRPGMIAPVPRGGGAAPLQSMHEKPTSFDIAFLAGVSQPTVSRALRGSPVVSLETRKRIEEIARQLNYRVDKNASNLRSQHSNTLALLLFEDPTPDDSQINPVLSLDAGLDHARLGAPGLRPADFLPAALARTGSRTTKTAARPTASSCSATATTRNTGRGSSDWSSKARISCAGGRCSTDNPASPWAATMRRAATRSRGTCWRRAAQDRVPWHTRPPTIPNSSTAIAAMSARCMEARASDVLGAAG